MVGLELPVLAMEHMYLLTEPMPEVAAFNAATGREMVGVLDLPGEIYTRQERGGVLLGTYEKDCRPWSPKATPWEFGNELLPPDLDRIAPSLEVGFRHFPALENAGIKQVINGPFTFAPDGNPLVGPVQGLTNFWVACAVMAGFSQGGGVGLVLANWMTDGRPGPRRLRHGRGALRRVGELALHQRQGAGELLPALLDPLPERGARGGAAAADDAALRHHGARAERGDGRDLGARGAALVRARRRRGGAGRAVLPPLERLRGGGRRGARGARGRRRDRDRQLRQVRGERARAPRAGSTGCSTNRHAAGRADRALADAERARAS